MFFLFSIFFSSNVFSAQTSQKLWGGIKNEDIKYLRELSVALKNDDYKSAFEVAKKMKGKSEFADVANNLAMWNKYSQIDNKVDPKQVSFEEISKFVINNKFFPNLKELRNNVEKVAIVNKVPYQISQQYFNDFAALNFDSKLYLLKATENIDKKDSGVSASKIWINENFSLEKERQFLENYGSQINESDHIARINRLLWDDKIEDAKRIFYLVNTDYQSLFFAIIQINKNTNTISKIVSSVPRSVRNNDLLLYKIIIWYKANSSDITKVIKIIKDLPTNLSNPSKWWQIRKLYGRELIKSKDYKTAYKILSNHGLDLKDPDFSDAEWTAGWVALRFLNNPKIAYNHFNNLYTNVSYPPSVSRATYWLGMASMAMGEKQKAINWYKIAAKYPVYFYGQLAIHKHRLLDSIDSQYDIILPKSPDILKADFNSMSKEMSLKVAYILALTGDKKNSTKIFEYIVNNAKTDGEISLVMKVVNEMDSGQLNLKISKAAAKKNVFFIEDKFQIIKEVSNDKYAPLVHAIIKQESGFVPTALSSVGAVGFMQLMPTTAQLVCKKNGIKYDRHKLASDINYNIILGSFYIKSLIDEFNGSELLAIAAYNAGPGASKKWINEFYDPRNEKDIDKVVDWIELITYSETRNYVQRIMENLIVYKYLMSRMNYDDIK